MSKGRKLKPKSGRALVGVAFAVDVQTQDRLEDSTGQSAFISNVSYSASASRSTAQARGGNHGALVLLIDHS
jgi:hypothetical protein